MRALSRSAEAGIDSVTLTSLIPDTLTALLGKAAVDALDEKARSLDLIGGGAHLPRPQASRDHKRHHAKFHHAAILLLLCASCKTTSSAESHASVDATQQTDTATAKVVTQRVETGPETVTTTVEEFAPAKEEGPPESSPPGPADMSGNPSPLVSASGSTASGHVSHAHGPLVKRTVIVDTKAPVVADTRTEATRATETHAEVKGEAEGHTAHSNAPAGIFGGLLALWPLLLLGALAVAAVVGWRVIRGRA